MARPATPLKLVLLLSDGQNYCSLIKPADGWTHWCEPAESVHGISQNTLLKHGRSTQEVALSLNDFLKNTTVYCDYWTLDKPWLITLFDNAKIRQTFSLSDITHTMNEQGYEQLAEQKKQLFKELKIGRHQATNDAKILQLAHQKITALQNT